MLNNKLLNINSRAPAHTIAIYINLEYLFICCVYYKEGGEGFPRENYNNNNDTNSKNIQEFAFTD
jgi:hypothetical protein